MKIGVIELGRAPIDPEAKPNRHRSNRRQSTPQRSAMPDSQPIPKPSTVKVVEPLPRREARPADPCAIVIFGAGGDLTKRLVVPALYNLARTKVLPEKFALIGVDLAAGTAENWRDHLYDMMKSFVRNASAE